MPDSLDRRASPRWVTVKNQATLEFLGGDGKQRAKATLVNISRSGALIPVRHDQPHQIGFRFAKPCLDDLLLAAMLGIDLGATVFEGGRPPTLADSWVGA